MRKSERAKWGLCFGMAASFLLTGGLIATASQPAQATPGGVVIGQNNPQPPAPTQGGNQAAAGRRTYDRVCGRCHPGGEEDIGPRLIGKNLNEARMTQQIRQGTGRMRAIPTSRLPDTEMPALMAYLRSIHAVH